MYTFFLLAAPPCLLFSAAFVLCHEGGGVVLRAWSRCEATEVVWRREGGG